MSCDGPFPKSQTSPKDPHGSNPVLLPTATATTTLGWSTMERSGIDVGFACRTPRCQFLVEVQQSSSHLGAVALIALLHAAALACCRAEPRRASPRQS